jgi:CRP/FNR family transcriptional regulator
MLAKPSQSADLVELFLVQGLKQTFKKGEFIIRPDETPSGVFYIKEGLVKAYNITKYQEENLLIIRKDQEIFPLIWALTGKERKVIYEALVDTVTYRISRQMLLDYLDKSPEGLAPILDMTMEMYRLHSERILNLEYRTVRERLISFLLTMSQRFGILQDNKIDVGVPLRHQDIASSINASRETTSRELSALEKKGLIKSKRSIIIIQDLSKIKKYIS